MPSSHGSLPQTAHQASASPTARSHSSQTTSYLIGKRPRSQEQLLWERHDVMAGMLPLLCMGDIVRERRVIGQLRQREATIIVPPDSPTNLSGIFDPWPPPKDWGDAPHRVLNKFEYDLGSYEHVRGAKCLCVQTPRMEYLFPATVILKTFYAFHTRVANAILSGRWELTYREVISTMKYESGIGTYVDSATGDWNIVVQPGLTREHAVRLALLYFDNYARQCANAIHSSALQQTHGRRGDDERFWFADAQIPFRRTDEPFQMRVRGFPLRPYRPPGDVTRFIVTRIEATSWPLVDQVINSEIANSNALGSDAHSRESEREKLNRPYFKSKPPAVSVREDAGLNHQSDAYLNAADNQAAAEDFCFLNSPLHLQQQKRSHKEYLGATEPIRSLEAPRPVVSAGNLAPGEEKPAPLVADSKDRHPCRQLQFLLKALGVLFERHVIEGFDVLGPPEDSRIRIIRNNVACWSFLTEAQVSQVPARGWVFLFDRPRGDGGPRRAFARCLLVIQVTVHGQQLLLFEVEPRLSETGYRLYVCEPTEAVHWTSVVTALDGLRSAEGRLHGKGLIKAFTALTKHPVRAVNHFYERDGSDRIVGLDADALYRALTRQSTAVATSDLRREDEHSRNDQVTAC